MFEFTIHNGTPEQGTSIMSIRKFYQGGMIRTIGFASLPSNVKQKLLDNLHGKTPKSKGKSTSN